MTAETLVSSQNEKTFIDCRVARLSRMDKKDFGCVDDVAKILTFINDPSEQDRKMKKTKISSTTVAGAMGL